MPKAGTRLRWRNRLSGVPMAEESSGGLRANGTRIYPMWKRHLGALQGQDESFAKETDKPDPLVNQDESDGLPEAPAVTVSRLRGRRIQRAWCENCPARHTGRFLTTEIKAGTHGKRRAKING